MPSESIPPIRQKEERIKQLEDTLEAEARLLIRWTKRRNDSDMKQRALLLLEILEDHAFKE